MFEFYWSLKDWCFFMTKLAFKGHYKTGVSSLQRSLLQVIPRPRLSLQVPFVLNNRIIGAFLLLVSHSSLCGSTGLCPVTNPELMLVATAAPLFPFLPNPLLSCGTFIAN